MRRAATLLLAAAPGLVIAAAALAGWAPTARDLPTYFMPLRARTAEVLGGVRSPWWNPDVGCGEPFLANPQTALAYPPAWLAALLPVERAVGVEIGLHLAWLAAGCALLAGRLGARGLAAPAAGWAAALAGPVLESAGVLNNLDALAWLPWAWVAALAGAPVALAGCLTAAFLAGEPQLAVMGGIVAAIVAPRRRTFAALALAVGFTGAVLLPFAAWIVNGDRGPHSEIAAATAGAVLPAELPALAIPALPQMARSDPYVAHLLLPGWVLLLGVWAALRGKGPSRRLAWCGLACIAAAVAAGLPFGREAWFFVTAGFLRFPSRLLFVAVVLLAPVAAAAAREVRVRPVGAAIVAAVWLALGVGLGGGTVPVAVQAATSAGALIAPVAPVALVVGAAAIAPANLPALGLRAGWRLPEADCLAVQRGAVRLYTVAPSADQLRWAAPDAVRRQVSLGLGYSGLLDGRSIARSFAPVQARALADHLGHADRGPAQRWWLDALGADALVAHHLVPGFGETCQRGELRVLANPAAWPLVAVLAELPAPGTAPRVAGDVLVVERRDDGITARVRVDGVAGVVSLLLTPDPGWRYLVDGRPTSAVVGAGIVHGVAVPGGEHEVRASYHPPLLAPGLALSLASVLAAAAFAVGGVRRARTAPGRAP